MNERLKELAEQAKKYALDAMIKITDKEQALKVYSETYDTKFAELVRQDETKACAEHYLGIMRDAVEQAVLKEREACASLVEADGRVHPKSPDAIWAKTVAKLIRSRSNHETT
jgi:hypothetical protein